MQRDDNMHLTQGETKRVLLLRVNLLGQCDILAHDICRVEAGRPTGEEGASRVLRCGRFLAWCRHSLLELSHHFWRVVV